MLRQGGEVGNVGSIAHDGETTRILRVAVVPVDELIARVGHCRQRARSVLVILTCASDGATSGRVGIGRNGVGLRNTLNRNGSEIGLVLLTGDHHVECASARDGIGEVHGSHTRRVGFSNAVDDRAVVGDGNVRTSQGIHRDRCSTRSDLTGYRHTVRFRLGDVRHHGTVAEGVVELEIIVRRVGAVAISNTGIGVIVGNSLLHSEVTQIQ